MYNRSMTTLNFNRTAIGQVLDIHDGDTLTLSIRMKKTRMKDQDLGYHVHVEGGWITLHTPIRFYGINAPELATVEGIASLEFLQSQVSVGDLLTVETALNPGDKYGRWLGILFKDKVNLNDLMVSSGNAVVYLIS